VSPGTAANVRSKIARPLSSTRLELSFYIVSYDDEKKQWYEAVLVKNNGRMTANLDTTDGKLQIFVDNTPTRISDTLDVNVYKLEFQVVPAKDTTSLLEFATGPTQRLVKQWGAAEE